MIELSHIYGRLALAFGALLIPMAVCTENFIRIE
jgi:hypothetical protein